MAKIISFATQKGGVGKSTLLMLTAAAVHNRTGKKVLVIDCDPQKSVKEIYSQENDPNSYDVITFDWKQPKPEVNFDKTIAIADRKYDVIFLDIPGRIEGREVYFSILISDYVVIPIVASALDINATIAFLQTLPKIQQIREKEGSKLEIFGVINKKDQTIEHTRLKELTGLGGLQLFYSPISNLVRYRRHISTVHDIVNPEEDDEFNRYFDEFRTKCYI